MIDWLKLGAWALMALVGLAFWTGLLILILHAAE